MISKNKIKLNLFVILNVYAKAFRVVSEACLSVRQEPHNVIMFNILRFFATLRMTKSNPVILREAFPIFYRDCDEISLRNLPRSQEISPVGRNDNRVFSELPLYKGLKSILLIVLTIFVLAPSSYAQNIMQVDDANGTVNNNVTISLSVQNDEEFISFQCDVVLPDGFNYIPGSVSLTPRSVDHVVNVTNIEDNTIRILSYSLNNTTFLLDSGVVARFNLSTPSTEGDYFVGIENGIIGNAQSVNILDSLVDGEITLGPIGVAEINVLEDKIKCFPNPFNETLTIQLDVDYPQPVKLQVFDIRGVQLSEHDLQVNNTGINIFSIDIQSLLGSNPPSGTYLLHFNFLDKNHIFSIEKKIQLKK